MPVELPERHLVELAREPQVLPLDTRLGPFPLQPRANSLTELKSSGQSTGSQYFISKHRV